MKRFEIPGIRIPEIVWTNDKEEYEEARLKGLRVIYFDGSELTLMKCVMLPALRRLLPGIDWPKALGITEEQAKQVVLAVPGDKEIEELESLGLVEKREESEQKASYFNGEERIADIAVSERTFEGKCDNLVFGLEIGQYCGIDNQVNIDKVMSLRLMPTFLSTIVNEMRYDIDTTEWQEGWNKKLGAYVGTYEPVEQVPNLLIIDVSYSIPAAIADTMLTLANTLRYDFNADLIITGGKSMFWSRDDELPSPEKLRAMIPGGNEREQFTRILMTEAARKYGTVVSFGDNDTPGMARMDGNSLPVADKVMHLHTMKHCYKYEKDPRTGYAKWTRLSNPGIEEEHIHGWCDIMVEEED